MHTLLSEEQFAELYTYLASDERLGSGPGMGNVICAHTLHYTLAWMKEHHIQDILANAEKMIDLGGHCDCEVLQNVSPATWTAFREDAITGPEFMGESAWEQFVSGLLYTSGYSEEAK